LLQPLADLFCAGESGICSRSLVCAPGATLPGLIYTGGLYIRARKARYALRCIALFRAIFVRPDQQSSANPLGIQGLKNFARRTLRPDFFRKRLDFGRRKLRHFRHKARFANVLKTLACLQIEVERRANYVWTMDFQDQTRIGPCQRRACFREIEAKVTVEIGADIDRVRIRRFPTVEACAGKAGR